MLEEIVPILRVADADAAVAWYKRLGFRNEWEHIRAVVTEFGRPAGDQPYGCDFELRDPDVNRLRISTRAR
jgi:hypothetical protein